MKTIGGVMKVEGTAFGPAARSADRGVARGRTVRNMATEKRRPEEKISRVVQSSKIQRLVRTMGRKRRLLKGTGKVQVRIELCGILRSAVPSICGYVSALGSTR